MKMKLYCLALLFIMMKTAACQNTLVQFEVKNQGKINICELLFNDSISVTKTNQVEAENKSENMFFIKNKIVGKAYFTERVLSQRVHVSDSIYLMNWELTSDTITILDQKCQAAKTVFRGRSYTAWYAPAFNTDEGPWKFGGLPGLILAVKSGDDFMEWKAIKIIENYSTEIKPVDITGYKFVGWAEFVTMYKQSIARFIKATRSSGKVANEINAKIKLESLEIFYPELQTGEGIKF